jgi:hypothetical protein
MTAEKLTTLRNAPDMQSRLAQILKQGWDIDQYINNPLLAKAETELTLESILILLLTTFTSYTQFHPCGGIEVELRAKTPRFIDAIVADPEDAKNIKALWEEYKKRK